MSNRRQPIDLVLLKGKSKHLTKAEIEKRRQEEVKAPADKIEPPSYLPADLHKEFIYISQELSNIGIMSNLDVDALARLLMVQKTYLKINQEVMKAPVMVDDPLKGMIANPELASLITMQDKLFKQVRQGANDLGLSISSRCKLVVPKKEEKKKKTEEEELFGDAL